MTDDWRTLAKPDAAVRERLAALDRVVQGDAPEGDVFCAVFIERLVVHGNVQAALVEAAERTLNAAPLPERVVREDRSDAGPPSLVFDPYEVRSAVSRVIAALGRRSHARPGLARFLFEALKLYAYERGRALVALSKARVERAILWDGIESLVRYAAADERGGGKAVGEVALAWRARPDWIVPLATAIARSPVAADAVAERLWGNKLHRSAPALDEDAYAQLAGLAARAPSGARSLALQMLFHAAREDGLPVLVLEALSDGTAHAAVIEAAAWLALRKRYLTAEVRARAEAARKVEHRGSKRALGKMVEALGALVELCDDALAPPPTAMAKEASSLIEGPFHAGGLVALGELALAAYRLPRVRSASPDWRTDDDGIGVVVLGPHIARRHVAPVRFDVRATGAAGARREVETAGVIDGRVLVVVQSPFSDERGWGKDNYVLGCDVRSGDWVAYEPKDGVLHVARELSAEGPESELPSACSGEAIVWVEGESARFAVDGTPYHLDDWEHTGAVLAAFAARKAARANAPWRALDERAASARLDRLAPEWPAYRPGSRRFVAAIEWAGNVAVYVKQFEKPQRAALMWARARQ